MLEEVSSGLDCGGKYKMAKRKSIVLSRRTPVGCGASDDFAFGERGKHVEDAA